MPGVPHVIDGSEDERDPTNMSALAFSRWRISETDRQVGPPPTMPTYAQSDEVSGLPTESQMDGHILVAPDTVKPDPNATQMSQDFQNVLAAYNAKWNKVFDSLAVLHASTRTSSGADQSEAKAPKAS